MNKREDEDFALAEDEEVSEKASPYNVVPGAMAVNGFSDFIPNPDTAKDFQKKKEKFARLQMQKKLKQPKPVQVAPGGPDFVSNDKEEARKENFSIKVRERAKEIYNEYKGKNKTFQEAKQKILNATQEELDDPTKELATAIALVDLGKPMTRKLAVELAEKELETLRAEYH
jgi:hypothetical protein